MSLGTRTLVSFFAILALVNYGLFAGFGQAGGLGVGVSVLGFLAAMVYFAPSMLAFERKHTNATAIFVVNFIFGWTLIGWVGALIWSLTRDRVAELLEAQARDRDNVKAGASRRAIEPTLDSPRTSVAAPRETRACPFCAEQVLVAAVKCKHCGSDLATAPGGV